MKIKAVISGFFLFIISFCLNGQTKRFIEVTAIDTIELKPTEFTYQVTPGYKTTFPITVREKMEDEPEITIGAIKKVLDKISVAYEVKHQGNYSVGLNKAPDSSIFVHLRSEAELNRLYKFLLTVKGITGKVSDAKYEMASPLKAEVYQRLFSKALADATAIAKVSGSTIGQLLSVEEPRQTDFMSDYMNMFSEMAGSEIFSEMLQLNKSLIKKVEKKLLFKFEML